MHGIIHLCFSHCLNPGVAQKSNAKMEGVKGSTAINVQNQVDGEYFDQIKIFSSFGYWQLIVVSPV